MRSKYHKTIRALIHIVMLSIFGFVSSCQPEIEDVSPVDELPGGVSIFGRAWSEPILLGIAYAYEQGTKHRKAPQFLE